MANSAYCGDNFIFESIMIYAVINSVVLSDWIPIIKLIITEAPDKEAPVL